MQKFALVLQHEEPDLALVQPVVMTHPHKISSAPDMRNPMASRRNWQSPSPAPKHSEERYTHYSVKLLGVLRGYVTRLGAPLKRLFRTPCEGDCGTPSPDPRWMPLDATTTLAIHPCSYPRHLRNCARPVWCASALVDLALLEPRTPLLAHIRSCRSSFPDFCVLANLTSVLLLGAAG